MFCSEEMDFESINWNIYFLDMIEESNYVSMFFVFTLTNFFDVILFCEKCHHNSGKTPDKTETTRNALPSSSLQEVSAPV